MRVLDRCLFGVLLLGIAWSSAGCGGDEVGDADDNEVYTTVTLTLTPAEGGTPIVAGVDDPDGDGGDPPIITGLTLSPGSFDMTVTFQNKLAVPVEDITQEVRDEGFNHQVFFTGTAVQGPASLQPGAPLAHAYADVDTQGLPVGLANKITAVAGTGQLTVTVKHMPPLGKAPIKVAGLAETVRSMGFSAIGGSTDVQVTLPVTVQ